MEIEVNLAVIDWSEIPTDQLEPVCTEARKQAGAFLPSNGLVATVWRDIEAERRKPKREVFQALPTPERTESEKAEISELCQSIIKKMSRA